MTTPEAIAAPRASGRNTLIRNAAGEFNVTAEPGFIEAYGAQLTPYGHKLMPSGDAFTSAAEIGAATAIEFLPDGRTVAAAEPTRRGGGSAMVLHPSP
jgi:gamma-glutamyltranspeptidase/glutathione hydrolase